MRKLERLKEFVINEKKEFKDGIDINDVKKHYRKVFNFTPDRKDVVDALIELRKDGIIKNDFSKMKMVFTKKKAK